MKSIKTLVALLALLFSALTYALNDDQEMEFTGAVNVGDIVTVRDANNQLLTATVTEEGLVYNDILFTCTEWQSNICKTTAKFS